MFYVIPGMQAWRNQDQVWEQQTKTHQRPVKCNKESVNLGHKKQRLCYLPPPNPQVIHLLGLAEPPASSGSTSHFLGYK